VPEITQRGRRWRGAATRRAQAAVHLRAQARIAMTGTPVENRLEDLHGIFRFLSPSLLGSAESFAARFVRPLSRDRDPAAEALLRRVVGPFVLRRTKTDVLPELPARTEVTRRVALNVEEIALYEAIRAEALASFAAPGGGGEGRGGQRRIQILAVITRLRRAASHPRLVLPEAELAGSKLSALGELLDEILPGGHRVLVFSQFVDHLTLVRAFLDERRVTYQYLDGSTPAAARKAAIAAFQAGEGDAFLISLRAGGFGLNLTAADVVVHMDPWWNPAVEDQASDRAHRIGQTRPVTIYRLVARDTIEDQILALHHKKRELAASLLEGTDVGAAMSEDEMLDLIRASGREGAAPKGARRGRRSGSAG
jgi:SNF2 family DNA or RNA helicase